MTRPGANNFRERVNRIRRMIYWTSGITFAALISVLTFVSIDERVLATGSVWPADDSRLYAKEDGLLGEIFVREGTEVQAGQPVVALDTTTHQDRLRAINAAIDQATAQLAHQKLELERTLKTPLPPEFWNVREELLSTRERSAQARSEFERASNLHAKGLISSLELDQSRLNVELNKIEETKQEDRMRVVETGLEETIKDAAVASYDAALSGLKALEVERDILTDTIERAIYRSPDDGIVTLIPNRRSGQRVAKGDILAHIAHGPPTRVDLHADESQIYRVRPGQRVLMRSGSFDALRYGYIEGKVEYVALQPDYTISESDDPNPAPDPSYQVIASIESSPQPLALGSTVDAKVILRRVPLWQLLLPVTE